jgi:hypothetical protein
LLRKLSCSGARASDALIASICAGVAELSIALYTSRLRPVVVSAICVNELSKSPTVAVVRYVAVGSSSRQRQVRVPSPFWFMERSSPTPKAVFPSGTVTRVLNLALSVG